MLNLLLSHFNASDPCNNGSLLLFVTSAPLIYVIHRTDTKLRILTQCAFSIAIRIVFYPELLKIVNKINALHLQPEAKYWLIKQEERSESPCFDCTARS